MDCQKPKKHKGKARHQGTTDHNLLGTAQIRGL
jgi:hypothetical protein